MREPAVALPARAPAQSPPAVTEGGVLQRPKKRVVEGDQFLVRPFVRIAAEEHRQARPPALDLPVVNEPGTCMCQRGYRHRSLSESVEFRRNSRLVVVLDEPQQPFLEGLVGT